MDETTSPTLPSPTLPLKVSLGGTQSYERDVDDDAQAKALVVFELIEDEQWNDLLEYIQSTPTAAKCRNQVSNSAHFNLPLHEVCRRQPPVRVVNALLDAYDEAVVVPGQYGFLPLHVACGSGASGEVVTRLLEAFPAATRCRDDLKDSLPLHLAAKWGASEDVLVQVLTTHPEGCFMRDSTGKTPLDLAWQAPESESKRATISALQAAPILVASAKSAARTVEREMESRLRAMQEAHSEFIRQLEHRHEQEKTEFLQLEVEFHEELATEKERNCELAELILNQRKAEFKESDHKKVHMERLESQRREYQERWENHNARLKAALDGLFDSPSLNGEKVTNDHKSWRQLMDVEVLPSLGGEVEQVAFLVKNYRRAKDELAKVSGNLLDRDETIISLKESLDKKKRDIHALTEKVNQMELDCQAWGERVQKMTSINREAVQELNSAKNEINRLSRKCESQQQLLEEFKVKQKMQETRMLTVKNLVVSLASNVGSWGDFDEPSVCGMLTVETSTPQKGKRATLSSSRNASPKIATNVDVLLDNGQNVSSITQETFEISTGSTINLVEDNQDKPDIKDYDASFESMPLKARRTSVESATTQTTTKADDDNEET
jgi:hypothetical protein